MEFLLVVLLILALVGLAVLWRKMDDLKDDLHVLRSEVAKLRPHQGSVTARSGYYSTPRVDARARTTVRDSDDIEPRGGKMVQGIQRRKRDFSDGQPDND